MKKRWLMKKILLELVIKCRLTIKEDIGEIWKWYP